MYINELALVYEIQKSAQWHIIDRAKSIVMKYLKNPSFWGILWLHICIWIGREDSGKATMQYHPKWYFWGYLQGKYYREFIDRAINNISIFLEEFYKLQRRCQCPRSCERISYDAFLSYAKSITKTDISKYVQINQYQMEYDTVFNEK